MDRYEYMDSTHIAKMEFEELDKRNLVTYLTDNIPFVGNYLKLNRLEKRRGEVLDGLTEKVNSEKLDRIGDLMAEHNQENIDNARSGRCAFKAICTIGSLVGIGYAISSYFN